MAIDIGDAVLTFLGDTTQLDAALNRVGAEVPAKLAPAEAALGGLGAGARQFGEELDATGENAEFSRETIKNAMGKGMSATAEAKGEATLLGEAFGIHLPRHVRTFIAELPGVGTALSAAFSATAVLFLIEALVQGTEKLSE